MLTFGIVSSCFEYLTFGVLVLVLRASPELFWTEWFVESVVPPALIELVVRSRRPFFRTMPSAALVIATDLVIAATVWLPYGPLARPFGFVPLPVSLWLPLGGIVLAYVGTAEIAKRLFYRGEAKCRTPVYR